MNNHETFPDVAYVDEFDRVRIRLEKPLPRAAGVALKRAGCVRVRQRAVEIKHHPRWRFELRLTRPTQACLVELKELLGEYLIASQPFDIEVSRDFITSDSEARVWIERQLLRSIVLRHRFPAVTRYRSCYFWGHRGDDVRVAMYGDRPHKALLGATFGDPCVHIEIRLRGAPVLRKFGVLSAGDLVHFNYEKAWCRVVKMIHVPTNKAALGRLLGRQDVSGTALRKRAGIFIQRGAVPNTAFFAVQNVIARKEDGARSELPRRMRSVDFNDWTRSVATKASFQDWCH